jgi:Fe-S-cluster-containing dehydrogenase component
MRCTSCKCCSIACPFGIIFQDFILYLDSKCDYCVSAGGKFPKCITTCPLKAIEVKEVKEDLEKDIYFVGEHLAVHTRKWSREDVQLKKNKC